MPEAPWFGKRKNIRARAGQAVYYELRPAGRCGNTVACDISESGMSVILNDFVPRLYYAVIRIRLSDNTMVTIGCKVVWSQRIPSSYRYKTGLNFVDVDPRARQGIVQYVNSQK